MRSTISTASGYATLLIFLVMGCGSGSGPARDPTGLQAGECVLTPGTPYRHDTISIVLTAPVDPGHAPIPVNDSERLVFRHLYETLVTVDCSGKVQPGLATSWRQSDEGRHWEFTLRGNARFSDGSHLTAEAVRESWTAMYPRLLEEPGPWVWVHPDSIRTMEDRILISLSEPVGEEPFLFAHAGLRVVPPTTAGWPVGSGPYLISHSGEGDLTLIPNPYHPETSRGGSSLEIHVHPAANERDLLSGPGDVVLIGDRSAADFGRGLKDWRIHALAWSRTYFLVSPELAYVSFHPETDLALQQLKVELSRDVVSSDAGPATCLECPRFAHHDRRGPEKPGIRLLSDPPSPPPPRIIYLDVDRDAGRLAERLVALAIAENQMSTSSDPDASTSFPFPLNLDPESELVAAGTTRVFFQDALKEGREWALVVSRHSEFPDPCLDRVALREHLEWFSDDPGYGSSPIVPLVSTRRHLALRRGLVGVETDWNGTVLLNRAGWAEEIAP